MLGTSCAVVFLAALAKRQTLCTVNDIKNNKLVNVCSPLAHLHCKLVRCLVIDCGRVVLFCVLQPVYLSAALERPCHTLSDLQITHSALNQGHLALTSCYFAEAIHQGCDGCIAHPMHLHVSILSQKWRQPHERDVLRLAFLSLDGKA